MCLLESHQFILDQSPHIADHECISQARTSFNNINTSGKRTICMSNSQIGNVSRWQLNILIHTVFLLLVSFWQLWIEISESAKNNTDSGPGSNFFFFLPFCLATLLDTANNNVSMTHETIAIILKYRKKYILSMKKEITSRSGIHSYTSLASLEIYSHTGSIYVTAHGTLHFRCFFQM